jgi:hypothetical protein
MASQLAPRVPNTLTPEEERLLELHRRGHVAAPSSTPVWRLAIEALLALRSLVALTGLALAVLLALSLASATGGLEQRVGAAVQRTGQAVTSAAQAVGDVFNPTHPPRYPISQDTEFTSFLTLHPGDAVGQSADYTFTLADIRRRDDASGNPDIAQYAVLQRHYRTPRETKLLGITVFVDKGEQQYALDRGVTFRIGSQLYKVNWISAAEQQMAIGVYRNPDQFAGKLAFDSN